jgi:hypothetical protein
MFIVLTAVHVFANYKGLGALVLSNLNRQRTTILIDHYLRTGLHATARHCTPLHCTHSLLDGRQ